MDVDHTNHSGQTQEEPGLVDTKPYILLDNTKYWEKGRPVEALPEGYVCVGELSAEEAQLLTGLIGCKVYKAEGKQDLYLYQKCYAVVVDTIDMSKPYWAYQRWAPPWVLD